MPIAIQLHQDIAPDNPVSDLKILLIIRNSFDSKLTIESDRVVCL